MYNKCYNVSSTAFHSVHQHPKKWYTYYLTEIYTRYYARTFRPPKNKATQIKQTTKKKSIFTMDCVTSLGKNIFRWCVCNVTPTPAPIFQLIVNRITKRFPDRGSRGCSLRRTMLATFHLRPIRSAIEKPIGAHIHIHECAGIIEARAGYTFPVCARAPSEPANE